MTVDNSARPSASTVAPNPKRWWALVAVSLAISVIIMDATVMNVALPTIIVDLGLTSTEAEWMNAIYSLCFAALLLTSGRIGDMWGRRKALFLGLGVFTVASVFAGLANGPELLIAARLAQGLGAALILPATLSTLNAIFVGKERGIAFAVWGSTIGGMAAVGPYVGGTLTTDVSWRWAFWLNIPVGLVVLALGMWAVPESRDEVSSRRLDLLGVALSALGLGGIVFALIEGGNYGWFKQEGGSLSPVPVVGLVGVALVAAFLVSQSRGAREGRPVLVDLSLMRIRSFRYGAIAALVVALGEFGLLFTLPLLLQNALGYSAHGTGVLLLWLAVGTFLVSGATPRLTAALGGRAVVRIGLATEVIAVAGLAATLRPGVASFTVGAWLFLYGVGVGMATAQLTSVILADVPVAQSGQASGLQSTIRQLGSALGVALLGTTLFVSLEHNTESSLLGAGFGSGESPILASQVRESAGSIIMAWDTDPAMGEAATAAADALVTSSTITASIAAGVISLGLLATLALPKPAGEQDPSRPEPAKASRKRRSPGTAD